MDEGQRHFQLQVKFSSNSHRSNSNHKCKTDVIVRTLYMSEIELTMSKTKLDATLPEKMAFLLKYQDAVSMVTFEINTTAKIDCF